MESDNQSIQHSLHPSLTPGPTGPHSPDLTPAGSLAGTQSNQTSPSAETKPKLRAVERGSQACNECRRHKIRCHPAPDDPEHIKPCARCVRMSLECVFKKHNRGRKRKNPLPPDVDPSYPQPPQKHPHLDEPNLHPSQQAHLARSAGYWDDGGDRGGSPDRHLDRDRVVYSGLGRYPFLPHEPPLRDHGRLYAHRHPHPDEPGPSRQGLHPHQFSTPLRPMAQNESSWDEGDEDEYSDGTSGGIGARSDSVRGDHNEQDRSLRGDIHGHDRDHRHPADRRVAPDMADLHHDYRTSRDPRDPRDSRDARDIREQRDHRDRDLRDSRDLRDPRDNYREPRYVFGRDPHPPRANVPPPPPPPPATNAHVPNGHHAGDPVTCGYIAIEDARILFKMFIKHFNAAMPLLDPIEHTHDVVRQQSPFLYCVILCITSRYLSILDSPFAASASNTNTTHHQIVILTRDHLTWAFAETVCTIDVIQAVVALSLWKEPDDDKAAYYFNRAVVMAIEMGLGKMPSEAELSRMNAKEKRELRHQQRLWMTLFSANSIFHMQFQQPMLMPYTDPLISTSPFWLKNAPSDYLLLDTFTAFNADLRRRFLHYRDLLTEASPPSALSLSVLTKTMNAEWEVTAEAWIREIIDAGGTATYVHKPRVWYSSLALNLNLMILNQTLRISPEDRIPPAIMSLGLGTGAQLRSIQAFHHCLNAATTVLLRFQDLDKDQIAFASDMLLHFALYAATFLWSLCRSPELYDFEIAEVDYTRELILNVARTFDSASAYPGSSPALHANYLRRLCRSHKGHEHDRFSDDIVGRDTPFGGGRGRGYGGGGDWNATGPTPSGGDYLMGDFPWAGLELPWTPIDESLFVTINVNSKDTSRDPGGVNPQINSSGGAGGVGGGPGAGGGGGGGDGGDSVTASVSAGAVDATASVKGGGPAAVAVAVSGNGGGAGNAGAGAGAGAGGRGGK